MGYSGGTGDRRRYYCITYNRDSYQPVQQDGIGVLFIFHMEEYSPSLRPVKTRFIFPQGMGHQSIWTDFSRDLYSQDTGQWFQTFFILHFIYGMSSFPVTKSYFSSWLLHHQPDDKHSTCEMDDHKPSAIFSPQHVYSATRGLRFESKASQACRFVDVMVSRLNHCPKHVMW